MSDQINDEMISLLIEADKAMSRNFTAMKSSQLKIRKFMASARIPKSEFNDIQEALRYAPLDYADKLIKQRFDSLTFSLVPSKSKEFIDKSDLQTILSRSARRAKYRILSADAVMDDMLKALSEAYDGACSMRYPLIHSLNKLNDIIRLKRVDMVITTGKEILEKSTLTKEADKELYEKFFIVILKLNVIKFHMTMLEEKHLGYIVHPEGKKYA